MSLLAAPALILLLATVALVALAAFRQGPKQRAVGTLLIWRRIAEQALARNQRRRNFDWLLWVLLAAVLIGGFGAARPAWIKPSATPHVAVFIERLRPGPIEPQLKEAMERARRAAPGAEFSYYLPGAEELEDDTGLKTLQYGSIQQELAQFATRTSGADARVLLLHAPAPGAETLGVVQARVETPVKGAVFEITSIAESITVRETTDGAVRILGARIDSKLRDGGVTTYLCEPLAETVTIQQADGDTYTLRRRPLLVGLGEDWNTDAHRALFESLAPGNAEAGEPAVWLGSRERAPAVQIKLGVPTDVAGCRLSYDPGHPLFHDLPIENFDWLGERLLLPPDEAARSLLSVTRDGDRIGDLVRLQSGGVLEFAGDPFSHAPVAASALLLDNSIGVVNGVRPSERASYQLVEDIRLPSKRAALAAPFETIGEPDPATAGGGEPMEFTTWLAFAAGLLLLAATALVSRQNG